MFYSINQIIQQSTDRFGNYPAFSFKKGFRTKTYTYKEVSKYLHKIPIFFEKHGIKKGDQIIVLSLNCPEYAILILGALACGVILVPIDYRTNHETIITFLKRTQPKAIFSSAFFKPLFQGIHHKFFLFEELLEELEKFEISELPEQNPKHIAAILFTSGTTGEPKGTKITHENILTSVNNIRKVFSLPVQFRILSILPLSHALEMFGGLLITYSLGSHIHYIERINSITIVQALRRYKIQGMAVVPQILRLILQNVDRHVKEEKRETQWNQAHKLAPLLPFKIRRLLFKKLHQSLGGEFSLFVCGSAPLELKVAQIWEHTGITILEGYGASETTGFVSCNTLQERKLGTVGKIIPGIKYRLSESGELLVSGGNIVSGYFENPEKTSESFQNGWYHTGDIVSIDHDGFIKIIGRDKFKIVLSDGKKVYPEDIEKKLNNNPHITDSTVFGLTTEQGEIVHAELIIKDHTKAESIIAKVNEQLNPHEHILDYGIWSHPDFPRNKSLKVDREAVRREIIERNPSKHPEPTEKETKEDQLIMILKLISGKSITGDENKIVLAMDLKMDSLKRIELLALIEEELGVSIDEMKINSRTTISDLRNLIKYGKPITIGDGENLANWQFTDRMDNLRVNLQNHIMFPIFNIGFKVKGTHLDNLQKIKTPQLFIFNHVGMFDVATILKILPEEIRRKTAIAATSKLWHDSIHHKYLAEVFVNAFPFVKAEIHSAMRGNFDRVGEILDRGYNILISPEGNITHTGELLPFHTGAGYIAVEMGVPVTPFKILGYYELWPEKPERFLYNYLPEKFGNVEVIVGESITFSPDTPYEEATQLLRETMLKL